MSRLAILACTALALIVLGCGGGGDGDAQQAGDDSVVTDIARDAPESATVLLENDFVRVAEFHLAPGEALPPHRGRNRVVYALSDFKAAFTENGVARDVEHEKGSIHWHAAGDHAIANIGQTEARYLVVERKASRLLEAPIRGQQQDITHVAPDRSRLRFENDYMRVAEFTLAPGATLPSHHGTNRVMYALTPMKLKFESDAGNAGIDDLEAGQAHWHEIDTHAVENLGDAEAVFLVFELKK